MPKRLALSHLRDVGMSVLAARSCAVSYSKRRFAHRSACAYAAAMISEKCTRSPAPGPRRYVTCLAGRFEYSQCFAEGCAFMVLEHPTRGSIVAACPQSAHSSVSLFRCIGVIMRRRIFMSSTANTRRPLISASCG